MLAEKALERAAAGERLSYEEILALFEHADLLALGEAADRVRWAKHPKPMVTFVVDRNINYSNVCVSQCRFCAFYRPEGHPEAYLLSREEIADKVAELVALGGTQVLMQGGLHPALTIEFYEGLLSFLRERFPGVQLHCLSPPEVVHIARVSGLTIEQTLRRLREAGLGSLPGGGAEILCHRVRRALSPRKCTAGQWLEVMRVWHSLGGRSSATMMFGHIETFAERAQHLCAIRELQDETGGFTAFIPWTFQPQNTQLNRPAVGAYDYLRTLAVARLALDNVDNIQASWVTQGPKIAQLALRFGANDLGSTMIEENVVRAAGATFSMTRAEMEALIRDAGFAPRQRDTLYRLL